MSFCASDKLGSQFLNKIYFDNFENLKVLIYGINTSCKQGFGIGKME